jgi:hypothetical protein
VEALARSGRSLAVGDATRAETLPQQVVEIFQRIGAAYAADLLT